MIALSISAEANSARGPRQSGCRAVRLFGVSDVTDATFSTAVIEQSMTVPVVVDLWAEWCGPCKTLSPILEKVIAECAGRVELAKVDVDANPDVARAFRVQSIPAVYVLSGGQIIDSFVGAQSESYVREFIERVAPGATLVEQLLDADDEASLREALERDSSSLVAALQLGDLLRRTDRLDEAEAVLGPFAHDREATTILARIVLQRRGVSLTDALDATLEGLLERSGADVDARADLLLMLDALGPEDPRYVSFRRRLASRLY